MIAAALLLLGAALAPAGFAAPGPVIGPDGPVTATDLANQRAQNSPAIAVDPTDPRFVALASRVDAPRFDCSLHVSGDGGRSWLPAQPVPELPAGAERCYGPEIGFDREGTLYYLFVGLAGRGNQPTGVFLTSSRDRRAFGPPRQVLGPHRYQVRMAIDRDAGRHGRIHLVWLETGSPPGLGGFAPPPNPILHAHSDDGGATFSSPVAVSDPERARVVAPALALGAKGSVHVAYYDLEDDARDYQGLEGPRWEGTWSLVVSSSSDRGLDFDRHALAARGIVPPQRVMLIFTMPPPALAAGRDGRRWVAWPDGRNGDWDVFVAASPDRDQDWQPPRRLNDDPVGNGRHQYLPALEVDGRGRLHAVYYDRRADPANLANHVSYTFSDDGGDHFRPSLVLTTESSHSATGARYLVPSAAGLVESGSRLALRWSPAGTVLAAWTDTRNVRWESTHQDVFAALVTHPGEGPEATGSAAPGWLAAGTALLVLLALGGRRLGARRRRDLPRATGPTVASSGPATHTPAGGKGRP